MRTTLRLSAATLSLCPLLALASPADYIYSPLVQEGEREIDFKAGTADTHPRQSAATIGFGYGVTSRWFTEIYVKAKNEGNGTYYDAVEWENRFQLTETGQYPFETGFLLEIEKPKGPGSGWEVKWGPLLQTDIGRVQINFNPLLRSYIDSRESHGTEFLYQLQAKYRWRPDLQFGVQTMGDPGGRWDNWAPSREQNHRAGPAIFGKIPLEGRQAIRYNAAWLVGLSSGAPNNTLRLQAEYEF